MSTEKHEALTNAFALFNKKHEFNVGQIVEWKEGMQNKFVDSPFIVVEVLKEPIFDSTEYPSSAYFKEPLDIILFGIDQDGEFCQCHDDSRRFQPVTS